LNEVFALAQEFNQISFAHVFRERNQTADALSKEGLQLSMESGLSWKLLVAIPLKLNIFLLLNLYVSL
jgi:hypothetical protein